MSSTVSPPPANGSSLVRLWGSPAPKAVVACIKVRDGEADLLGGVCKKKKEMKENQTAD